MSSLRVLAPLALAAGVLSPLTTAQVSLPSTVYDGSGGPLLSGTVYTASSITIPTGQTLTVEPGAILKLSGRVYVRGVLDAQGTALQPIVVTSLADDAAGGDTNGDGGASQPAPGDWEGVAFYAGSTGSVLSHLDIAYHGDSGLSGLYFGSASSAVTISDCLVRDGSTHGVDLNGYLTLATLSDCELRDNAGHAVFDAHINSLPGLVDCTAQGNGLGDVPRVVNANLSGSVAITASNTIGGVISLADSPYIVAGETLDIGPGVTFKVEGPQRVYVYGTLTATGTDVDPVRFTSLADDALGGDTNKDGGATAPQPGDWQGIAFYTGSTGSALEHVEVAYHGDEGYSGFYFAAADSAASLTNCISRDGSSHGIDLNGYATTPTISACELRDNAGHAVFDAHINSLPGLVDCTALGNGLGDVPRVVNANLSGSVAITASNTIGGVISLADSPYIVAGETLDIGPGVTFKVDGPQRVYVYGTLTATGTDVEPVRFTSLADDALGGDTNKDGGATSPQPGDWQGIAFYTGSTGSALEHVEVAYHGDGGYSGFYFAAADSAASLTNCISRDGSSHGIDLNGYATTPTISACELRDNAGHAVFDAHINSLPGLVDCTAQGNGLGDVLRVVNANLDGDVAITASNTLGGVIVLADNPHVVVGETLGIGPGVTFKLEGNRRVLVYGTLDVLGTAEAPVTFTSLLDDSVAGDTNLDGAVSLPAPGDWQGLSIEASAVDCELRYVVARYAGGSGIPAVSSKSSSTVLDRVRVDHSAVEGFELTATDTAAGLVAYACEDGIVLKDGTFDLQRSTVADCSSRGIVATALHTGTVSSTLSYGSPTNWDGFGVTQFVEFSGGTGVPGGTANFNGDPLFVDAANGDLRLSAGSGCIDSGALGDYTTGQDMTGFPRRADGDLDGSPRLDMGAHEFSNLELTITGTPTPGGQIDFHLDGTPGFGTTWMVLGFGFQEYGTPVGSMFTDFLLPYILLGWPAAPNVVNLPLPPDLPAPFEMIVQAAARDIGSVPTAASTSNPVRVTIE